MRINWRMDNHPQQFREVMMANGLEEHLRDIERRTRTMLAVGSMPGRGRFEAPAQRIDSGFCRLSSCGQQCARQGDDRRRRCRGQFLNLATTNSSEAMELLDNLLPALITIVILYIPL